jgi:hypothetical protein
LGACYLNLGDYIMAKKCYYAPEVLNSKLIDKVVMVNVEKIFSMLNI